MQSSRQMPMNRGDRATALLDAIDLSGRPSKRRLIEHRRGHPLDALWNRKLLSRIGVDRELRIGASQATARTRARASCAAQEPRFELHHFLLLAAIAGLLVGVFWLSTASRSDLGFEAGSHLRSLARAHRVAESDGQAIQVTHSAVRVVSVLHEQLLFERFLPIEKGAARAATTLAGSRISRAPPAQAS